MTTSTLKVASTSYPPTGTTSRASARIALDQLVKSIDEGGSLEFHQYGAPPQPLFAVGQAVELDFAAPVFKGEISGVQSVFVEPQGWRHGYTCRDLYGIASATIPVTNTADLTGVWTFNLPSTDPNYVPSWAGQSVGQILALLMSGHAAALSAAGIAGFVSGDLAGLTLVPNQPVTFQGPSLLNAVRGFLEDWAGNVACFVDYDAGTSDWRVRFIDPSTFSVSTLTLGTDPVDPPSITADIAGCYTQVVIRGYAIVEPWLGSTLDGTLTPDWTSTGAGNQQSLWNLAVWTNPQGTSDIGTVTGTLTSTSAAITSSSPTQHVATNYWSTNEGQCYLYNSAATGITQMETRNVTANTAETAGAQFTVTLDYPLVNGGYTNYRLICQPPGGEIDVYRRYNIGNSQVKAHLVTQFPFPVAAAIGAAAVNTSYPMAWIVGAGATVNAQFEIDPVNQQIRFNQPVVFSTSTDAQLTAGGSMVVAPTDVIVLLAYSRGTLTATAPTSGFSGTGFTVAGITRTLYLDMPQWIRAGDQTTMDAYAAMKLATVSNIVYTGTVQYNGLYTTALALGIALNIAGNNGGGAYTTGWEAIAAPVRSVVLTWPGEGANSFVTQMALSNRRKQATGDTYYLHPQFTGGAAWGDGGGGQLPLGTQEDQAYARGSGVGVDLSNTANSLTNSQGITPDWQSQAKAGYDAQGTSGAASPTATVGGGPLSGGFGNLGSGANSLAPGAFGGGGDPLSSAVAAAQGGGGGGGYGGFGAGGQASSQSAQPARPASPAPAAANAAPPLPATQAEEKGMSDADWQDMALDQIYGAKGGNDGQ